MPISRYAMNYGLALGVYWIVVFFIRVLCSFYPSLSLAYIITLMGSLYVAFRMGRMFLQNRRAEQIPTTYMQFVAFGLFLFFYGALLDAIVQYVYYQYINPAYIGQQMSAGVNMLKSVSPNSGMLSAYEQMGTPSAIQMSMQIVWNSVLVGSMTFALLGLFMVKKSPTQPKEGGQL